MNAPNTPRLSVSTWSLHRTLGWTYTDAPGNTTDRQAKPTYGEGSLSLLELPAQVAQRGIYTLEICHFHLPSRETAYLETLRAALDAAGVELFSLLVDDGDITHPEQGRRDLDWMSAWVETAGQLGAQRARVIAGKQPYSPETMRRSREGLRELAARGQACGVRMTTENWYPLLSRPEYVHELLDSLEGTVGLNADFGNWDGPTKYADLASLFPRAESCHAKCAFTAPRTPDAEDYRCCLELAQQAGFSGPYTLIYDGPDADEWTGLALEADLVRSFL
ncbi:MAG TPA: TIM barrel protein [Chthonomonadaceae bacterium]|nr:TIM barrel protein [Chthonomonadaceae bacterium]